MLNNNDDHELQRDRERPVTPRLRGRPGGRDSQSEDDERPHDRPRPADWQEAA